MAMEWPQRIVVAGLLAFMALLTGCAGSDSSVMHLPGVAEALLPIEAEEQLAAEAVVYACQTEISLQTFDSCLNASGVSGEAEQRYASSIVDEVRANLTIAQECLRQWRVQNPNTMMEPWMVKPCLKELGVSPADVEHMRTAGVLSGYYRMPSDFYDDESESRTFPTALQYSKQELFALESMVYRCVTHRALLTFESCLGVAGASPEEIAQIYSSNMLTDVRANLKIAREAHTDCMRTRWAMLDVMVSWWMLESCLEEAGVSEEVVQHMHSSGALSDLYYVPPDDDYVPNEPPESEDESSEANNDKNKQPTEGTQSEDSSELPDTEYPDYYPQYLPGDTTVSVGCTPSPGSAADIEVAPPPALPQPGGWCYTVRTAEDRYAYAAAIVAAVEHREPGYTGTTPATDLPPPLLEISCEYQPLTNSAIRRTRGDDMDNAKNFRYHIEYLFMPRYTYDLVKARGMFAMVDIAGWDLILESSGPGLDLHWLRSGWNPPYLDTELWDSPIPYDGRLYGGGQLSPVFKTVNHVLAHFLYHGIDELAAPLDEEYYVTLEVPHRGNTQESGSELYSSSKFRIDATGDAQTDIWRYDLGEACALLGQPYTS